MAYMNKSAAGYFSFSLSVLFLAMYLFVVVVLLVIFACRKSSTWPDHLSNANADVDKSRLAMFIKIMLFYGKRLVYAMLLALDKKI